MSVSAISSSTYTPPPKPAATQAAAAAPPVKKGDGDGDHGVEPTGSSASTKVSSALQAQLTSLKIGG
jgi:hypothetical protein